MIAPITRRSMLTGLTGLSLASGIAGRAETGSPATLLIRNVMVFDGLGSARVPAHVRVTGDRISAVGTGDMPVPPDATIIDGAGQTLMPGLTDAHWHMWAVGGISLDEADDGLAVAMILKDAEYQLMRGFTTVRDTAGSVFGIKKAIDRGLVPGPRCFPSGAAISQTSGHGDGDPLHALPATLGGDVPWSQRIGMTAVANGVPEVLAAVRTQLKRGATQIKVMAGGGVTSDYDPIDTLQFTPEEMRAIVQAVGDWGTYVCAHVYTNAGIRRCLDAGVRSIEHGHLLDDATAALMAAKGAWLSNQPFEPGDNKLSNEQLLKATESLGTGGWETSVRIAKKHGVKVAFGTDLFSRTRSTRTENEMLPRLARVFSNAEVLRIATSGNCELLERSGRRNTYRAARLGVIQEGAWADMLVVKGNPIDHLELLADPETNLLSIIKNGVVHKNLLRRLA
jgi:imidazolonepropionase-like amidohydrolase